MPREQADASAGADVRRFVVTGGRDYNDKAAVWGALDRLLVKYGRVEIAHGGASGTDRLADMWARNRGQRVEPYPADWRIRGKAAGPERNRRMLDDFKPHGVVAFPGGRGTADCCKAADERGIAVWLVWVTS